MPQDEISLGNLGLNNVSELLEMEMEEYDPMRDKYSEVTNKVDQILKNLVLNKITNKRNELNILYLYQTVNEKKIDFDAFEAVFRELDEVFNDVNSNYYSFDELITKNNELMKRINPKVGELLK